MAKTQIISQIGTYVANGADTDYVLAFGQLVDSSTLGIDASGSAAGRSFLIQGEIEADQTAFVYGHSGAPAPGTSIDIGATGYIHSVGSGVAAYMDDGKITNAGGIYSQGTAVMVVGDGNAITNSGTIHANGFAVQVNGGGSRIENTGMISGIHGIYVSSADGDATTIVNSGTVIGHYSSVYGGSGDEKLINSGRIYCDLLLSDGEDTFVNKGKGMVSGLVQGGSGADTYVINRADLQLTEGINAGYDTAKSSVSYTLHSNFEALFLTGKADLKGTGNSAENYLKGNAGDNKLFGEEGADAFDGGRGTDVLTGGDGSDGFYFRPNMDKEIVTDFVDGDDHLVFISGSEIVSQNDMIKHHAEELNGNLVISGDGTVMVLKGMHLADFDSSDFIV
jgi:Ca2+-binding RTX toxin-like protein